MRANLILFTTLLGLLCSLSSAQPPPKSESEETSNSETETEKADFIPSENYRLKGGDEIQLIVYQEEELNKTIVLAPSGEATFSLLDPINFSGMTLAEACQTIEDAYKPDILKKPKVTLDLITSARERVTVSGAVESTGEVAFPKNGNLDITGALLRAGGLSKVADRASITVTRGKDRQTYHLDSLEEPGAEPVYLMNNDSIEVGIHPHANKTVLVMGEVHSPMDIPYPLDSPLTVGIALGRCGGVKATAHPPGITIQRGSKTLGLLAGSKTKLSPGDVLKVPPNPYIGKFVTVTGQVKTAGPVPFATNGSLSIVTAITQAGGKTGIADLRKVSLLRNVNGTPTTYTVNVKDILAGTAKMVYLRVNDIVVVGERRF